MYRPRPSLTFGSPFCGGSFVIVSPAASRAVVQFKPQGAPLQHLAAPHGAMGVCALPFMALNALNCLSSFLEPHLGHAGSSEPRTRISFSLLQSLQVYWNKGIA
jgi:hypothetical protein